MAIMYDCTTLDGDPCSALIGCRIAVYVIYAPTHVLKKFGLAVKQQNDQHSPPSKPNLPLKAGTATQTSNHEWPWQGKKLGEEVCEPVNQGRAAGLSLTFHP